MVDVLDGLMEKVDVFFDESKVRPLPRRALPVPCSAHTAPHQGETNKPNIHISAARVAAAGAASGRSTEYAMFHGSNIRRPQLAFADPVDNSNTHFLHKLLVKPNALVPLVRRACFVMSQSGGFCTAHPP